MDIKPSPTVHQHMTSSDNDTILTIQTCHLLTNVVSFGCLNLIIYGEESFGGIFSERMFGAISVEDCIGRGLGIGDWGLVKYFFAGDIGGRMFYVR